ncbi:hypothetical protein N7510_010963 [Penicillium lagena]|uniref:uncharacterized protein n=1 Tax=Penicillium lagena TaxID=94218 RepID=UPI00253FB7D5|nr:uncharacterized protein N7510_010963 [Penicillium lagena]KAJ5601429.1 hypothetical protein N7510_010963 [Penicillium lagena]
MQLYKILGVLLPITVANAHSWVEQLTVIAPNGTFVGAPGYARGNYLRTAPGFNDLTMTYLIPPDGASNVTLLLPSYDMCKGTQQNMTQTTGSPRLQASAGAAIALRYQENGHVTLPWNQPGKPQNRGTVYVYGTTEPKVGEKLLDVYGKWNENGTGGDGRGVLLSTQNFDDGRCYQINTGNISEYRQKEFPHVANQLMGANLWCQQDIRLPSTAPAGRPYTLYWVWDWPTLPGIDPTYPDGKEEIYTTCMDVDVVNTEQTRVQAAAEYVKDQNLDSAAIPSEFADMKDQNEAIVQTTHDTTGATATVTVTETVTTLVDVVIETVFVERCQSS